MGRSAPAALQGAQVHLTIAVGAPELLHYARAPMGIMKSVLPASVRLLAAACALTLLPSCYRYSVHPERVAPSTEAESRTGVHWFWGLLAPADVVPECPPGVALAEVSTQQNLGFIVVGAITLGIVYPETVNWRCAKNPARTDIVLRREPSTL